LETLLAKSRSSCTASSRVSRRSLMVKPVAFAVDTQTFMIPTEKILVAAEKRRSIRIDETNAVRLLDGSGDGLPGLTIDDFAGRWMVQTQDEGEPTLDPNLGYVSLYWKPML